MQILAEAEGYLELGMPEHALAALERIDDPGTFSSRVARLSGEAYRALEQYGSAISSLLKAAEGSPSNVEVRLALGWCYKRTEQLDLAIESLEEALEIDGDDALLCYNLACYYSLAGDKSRCLGYLSRALAIEPGYRDLVGDEPDFDPVRSDPDFQALGSIIV